MKFDLVLEPGICVGPVKLGMTKEEVASLGVDLNDDTFRVSFDDDGKCNEIQVLVFNNDQPVLLQGHDLNNISAAETRVIFDRLFAAADSDQKHLGFKCCKWEFGDDFYTFVGISRAESAPT